MWFHLSSDVNSQNSRICSATNAHEIKDTPLCDQKVGVWCAILQNQIIIPTSFVNVINSECYCEVILYPFTGYLNEDEIAHSSFSQDSVTVHMANVSMTPLRDMFRDNNFKGHLATMVTWSHIPWLLSLGINERCSLQRQSSHFPWTEGSYCKFNLENVSSWIAACLRKQAKMCRCMSTSMWGHFQHLL